MDLLRTLTRLYRRPLPQHDGRLRLPGIRQPIEILRDRWGVPHVFAGTAEDAVFAQGFCHAQDRLWQLELNRRVGQGRLAQLFGPVAVETDRLIRTIGLPRGAARTAASCDDESYAFMEAYARGVNAGIERARGKWPLELTLLRVEPEPWRPIDTFAWAQVLAWGLSTNWDTELVNAALLQRLGPERTARLRGQYPQENPIIIPDQSWASLASEVIAELRAAEKWLPLTGLSGASNNWVVDAHKSATGRPLLANDPHLSLQMPSIWYELHLSAPDLEVAGVSMPGAPGIVIGHNRRIAWGLTAAVPDTTDLFVEKLDPENPHRYEWQGRYLDAEVIREEIAVRGERPRTVEIVITRHGPIMNALSPISARAPQHALALKWIGHEPNRLYRAALKLARAHDWPSFREAMADWDAPSMNAVYADVDGNIGYQMVGRIPVRKQGRGQTPVPGWSGEYEWTGVIPPEELPHALNPERHFLLSANNRVVGREYPHFLGADTMNGHRARRIGELLQAKPKLAPEDFRKMQLDQHSTPARDFCRVLLAERQLILAEPALAEPALHALAVEAFELLARWDHVLAADSAAAAVYELAHFFAQRRILEPLLGELTEPAMGVGFHPILNPIVFAYMDRTPLVVTELLTADESDWWKGLRRETLLARALYDALHYLRTTLGPHPSAWSWGAVHYAGFNHPLGQQKPLDRIFDRGPYPYGGDTNTVWQAAFVPRLPIRPEGGFTASWRQILDVGNWDASIGVHTTGQSGHPASPHYDDQIPMWLSGEYHPLLWSRERIEAHLEARLMLEPA